jgi:chaperone modulatory protein CbpM
MITRDQADDVLCDLAELAEGLGVHETLVIEFVELGVVPAPGPVPAGWRFTAGAIERLTRAARLSRELELPALGAAVVLELLDERHALRARVRALERLLNELA